MIDLHSHLLVNLDDGSRSIEGSVDVLRRFMDQGVTAVVCTPHLAASAIARDGERHLAARNEALVALRGQAAGVELLPGFEIMLDGPLPAAAVGDRRYALAGSRYYLVEFPLDVAAEVTLGALEPLVAAGIVPVVAHPERYGRCDVAVGRRWVEAGCALQVDATTVTLKGGRGEKARRYVAEGLASVLAADNHGDPRGIWTGRAYLGRSGAPGEQVATLLTSTNPRRIVADQRLEPVPSIALKPSIRDRLRRLIS